jgi:hypothetical protein
MLQYEVTRKALLDKQQKKIDAMEARAAELRQQKLEREKQWAVAQRARELQKVPGAGQWAGMCCAVLCCCHWGVSALAAAAVPCLVYQGTMQRTSMQSSS